MKVIVAGLPKTGTKSMHEALEILGYSVYDFPENFQFLYDDWMKVMKNGGTTEDFRRMLKDVDSCVDFPSSHYWEQIHQAFPEAKIILTTRPNEDEWYASWVNQVASHRNWKLIILTWLSPSCSKFINLGVQIGKAAVGGDVNFSALTKSPYSELASRMWYRKHNAYVLSAAPKESLLVYNVREGWEPLCKFLGVEVPSTDFPHKNKNAKVVEETMNNHPIFVRIKREALISLSLIIAGFSYAGYSLMTSTSVYDSVLGIPCRAFHETVLSLGYSTQL